MTVRPIAEATQRLPTHGRIRTGHVAKGKKYPSSLKHFRLTSVDREALETLAHVYGGDVVPWNNPKADPPKQFEVFTTSDVLAVKLVPASVTVSYEKWGNGFLTRRCDGITCFARKPGQAKGDPVITQNMPCICNQNEELQCKPTTRLDCIFPDVRFKGTWMLQSGGWNVFAEMPGMARVMAMSGADGLIDAKLRLAQRQQDGGSKKFVVPVIELEDSLAELDAGSQLVLGTADEPLAIEAADPLAMLEEDDDVVEAEVVE